MRNSIKHLGLLLTLSLLLSCTTQPTVITQTDVARIPQGLLVMPVMPDIATAPLSIEDALELGKGLRRYGCLIHANTKEIVRYATLGDTVIEDLPDAKCAGLNN